MMHLAEPNPKKEGYYWVKTKDEPHWMPAWYIEPGDDGPGDWLLVGYDPFDQDGDFKEAGRSRRYMEYEVVRVGPRLEPPNGD